MPSPPEKRQARARSPHSMRGGQNRKQDPKQAPAPDENTTWGLYQFFCFQFYNPAKTCPKRPAAGGSHTQL